MLVDADPMAASFCDLFLPASGLEAADVPGDLALPFWPRKERLSAARTLFDSSTALWRLRLREPDVLDLAWPFYTHLSMLQSSKTSCVCFSCGSTLAALPSTLCWESNHSRYPSYAEEYT